MALCSEVTPLVDEGKAVDVVHLIFGNSSDSVSPS